ncbi:Type II secretion system protein F [Polystyrenella longa]|uniref:Type II secretion system protein F n=1 Tax=Polystyrenella longa TaxID=2528007 RepID=A0A518CN08_9PLAN|nr:type II secretion system F family protein [Polystyrenella longa]QDU80611.1 Type II secretion system protein F [Polystyrenella longa]
MFSAPIKSNSLILMCRTLGNSLTAGLDFNRAFKVTTEKTSDPRLRSVLKDVLLDITQGSDIATAMENRGNAFPELMTSMVRVGEHSGHFPEVLKDLAEHYERNKDLKRELWAQLTMPIIQMFAAIFIIAFMLLIIDMFSDPTKKDQTFDPLGLGLTGVQGAELWLLMTLGPLIIGFAIYKFTSRALSGKKFFHSIFMKIPVVSSCMHNFAIARFSWAFALTQQTGLSVLRCIDISLRATGNGVYMAASPQMITDLKEGALLSDAMRNSGLFTEEYLQIVEVAEETGTVPEQLQRISPQLQDEARRSLSRMASAFSWAIRTVVAVFIIFLIFRMALTYINMIQEATKEAM